MREGYSVFLIFSVTESGGFQGFAEMTSIPEKTIKPGIFKNYNPMITLNDNFYVNWLAKDIYYHFRNLNNFPPNPLNEDKTIMQSKNGQEIPSKQGNYLITLLLHEYKKSKTTPAMQIPQNILQPEDA